MRPWYLSAEVERLEPRRRGLTGSEFPPNADAAALRPSLNSPVLLWRFGGSDGEAFCEEMSREVGPRADQ